MPWPFVKCDNSGERSCRILRRRSIPRRFSQPFSPSMRLIFAGTPGFAATALDALLASSHKVAAVRTQPDRPA